LTRIKKRKNDVNCDDDKSRVKIASTISLNPEEIRLTFIRASGPGGQNVNKVATAVQLRFDIVHSPSLPETVRARLLVLAANKITHDGELIIKATRFRTQEHNKRDAIHRLYEWIKRASSIPKKRKKIKPTKTSIEKRLNKKKRHGKIKFLRSKKRYLDE